MAQLAPMCGASEAELEAAPMSLPILLQAMVFLLRASQSPPGHLSPCQQPASACTSRTRAERSQLSLQSSLSWRQQEVGLVCKGSLWSSGPLARGHHLRTLQFLGCISFSTQKLGVEPGDPSSPKEHIGSKLLPGSYLRIVQRQCPILQVGVLRLQEGGD